MRTTAQATAYFDNLKREFTSNVYRNASLRARGLSPSNNVYQEFYIFQNELAKNEEYEILTDLQRDNLIDFLIEQTL